MTGTLAIACLLLLGPSALFAKDFSCPVSIAVSEKLAQPLPEGWTSQAPNAPRYFSGVTFFDGNPQDNQSIAPTRDTPVKGHERLAVWQFGPSGGVWMGCRYIDSATVLTRALPESVRECRVVYAAGGVVKNIECH